MNLINTQDVASVILFDLRASEGELQYFAIALDHILGKLEDEELHALFADNDPTYAAAETREFLADMFQYLKGILREHCYSDYLMTRLKDTRSDHEFNYPNTQPVIELLQPSH